MTTPEQLPPHSLPLPAEAPAPALHTSEGIAPTDAVGAPETTEAQTIRFRRTRRLGGAMLFAGGLWCAAWSGIHGTEAWQEYREAMSDRRIAAEHNYDTSDVQQAINADLRTSADNHIDEAWGAAKPLRFAVPGAFAGAIIGAMVVRWNRKPKAAISSETRRADETA